MSTFTFPKKMPEIRDTVVEKIAAALVTSLNTKANGVKVVGSVCYTNTYFNKLFGGFPLLVIWRSRRYFEANDFSGSSITIHYLLASAADFQQVPGILNSVACWIYEAMSDYAADCQLLEFEKESYTAEATMIAHSGAKGTTELPLLAVTFNIRDHHRT